MHLTIMELGRASPASGTVFISVKGFVWCGGQRRQSKVRGTRGEKSDDGGLLLQSVGRAAFYQPGLQVVVRGNGWICKWSGLALLISAIGLIVYFALFSNKKRTFCKRIRRKSVKFRTSFDRPPGFSCDDSSVTLMHYTDKYLVKASML